MHRALNVILLSLLPMVVEGQELSPGLRNELQRAAASSATIRVTTAKGSISSGRISELTDTTVAIGRDTIALREIAKLERRRRSGTAGIIGGGLIGAVLGKRQLSNDPDSPCASCAVGAIALTGLGAVAGGLLFYRTHWDLLWNGRE